MAKRHHKKQAARREKATKTRPEDPADALQAATPLVRREWVRVAAIFTIAMVVRLIYFFINRGNNPLFFHPTLDGLFHHEWARDILYKSFVGDEVFFRAPLYPYWLALVYRLSGSSITAAVLCQHLIGAASASLVYLLARQYFRVSVATIAGFTMALYWPLIYFEGELLIVTMVVFLDVGVLLLLTRAIRSKRTLDFVLAGLVFGLSAIARPSILIVVVAVPFVLYIHSRRSQARVWLYQTGWMIAGLAVVVTPVLIRNYVVGRDIVPIASQGGVNFYIGNNLQSNGTQARVPGTRADLYGTYHGAIELAEQESGRSLKPSEVSNHYFKKGMSFIVSSPREATSLTARKFYYFWGGVERSNSKYIQFYWDRFGLGKIPLPGFWIVGPLALLGGFLFWRRRKELALLYVFVAAYMIGVVVFFVNARFRLPVVPVLILFSSGAVMYLVRAIRARSSKVLKAVVGLTLCVVIVDYDFVTQRGVRAFDIAVSHYELANAYLKTDDTDRAIDEFEAAYRTNERYPTRGYAQIAGNVEYQLGSLYWIGGLYQDAIRVLGRTQGSDSRSIESRYLLADSYVKVARPAEAIRVYQSILESTPGELKARIGLAVALREEGDLNRSEEILSRILEGGSNAFAHLELAKTYERQKRFGEAIPHYQAAGRNRVFQREAHMAMARLFAESGQISLARDVLSKLREQFPGDPEIESRLRTLSAIR